MSEYICSGCEIDFCLSSDPIFCPFCGIEFGGVRDILDTSYIDELLQEVAQRKKSHEVAFSDIGSVDVDDSERNSVVRRQPKASA